MNLSDLEPTAIVRLKFFLARQSEGRFSPRGPATAARTVTEQQAAILSCMAYMQQYAGRRLIGREICALLGIGETRLSNVMDQLEGKKLVAPTDDYYQITPDGLRELAEFADRVLGVPEEVARELRADTVYQNAIGVAGQLIDKNLHGKFEAVVAKPSER